MLEKITERVYYMMNEDATERPVIGLIIGEKYSMIVDGGVSKKHMLDFKKHMEEIVTTPLKYLTLTHSHWDHSFGMKYWNLINIGHEKANQLLQCYQNINFKEELFDDALRNNILSEKALDIFKNEYDNIKDIQINTLDITYKDELSIDLGEIHCELSNIVSPHTEDSTIVYIPEEKVLFLGDASYGTSKDGKQYMNRDKLIRMIAAVESYDAEYYVCSHESVCSKEEIVGYFNELKEAIRVTEQSGDLEQCKLEYHKLYGKVLEGNVLFFVRSILNV